MTDGGDDGTAAERPLADAGALTDGTDAGGGSDQSNDTLGESNDALGESNDALGESNDGSEGSNADADADGPALDALDPDASDAVEYVDRPFEGRDGSSDATDARKGSAAAPADERETPDAAPLEGLASEVRRRRAAAESDAADDLFESAEVPDLDTDEVWVSLSAPDDGRPAADEAVDAARVETGAPAVDEYVVPKSEFCQRCSLFSAPPEVACEHEEARIAEVVDSERFRVRDCPFATEENPD